MIEYQQRLDPIAPDCRRETLAKALLDNGPWNSLSYRSAVAALLGRTSQRRALGSENRPLRNAGGFRKPQQHWGTVDVVVDKLGGTSAMRLPAIETGAVVFFEPAQPVLLLGLVPDSLAAPDVPGFQRARIALGDWRDDLQLANLLL